MTDEIERVANGLSSEAKASLLDGCACGVADELEALGMWEPEPGAGRPYYITTVLGRAVRRHLQEKAHD